MDHYEAYPSEIWISFFVPRQYILEYHLQNGGHFVYLSMYQADIHHFRPLDDTKLPNKKCTDVMSQRPGMSK